MSEVKFNEPSFQRTRGIGVGKIPALIIKLGLAKDRDGATKVMLAGAILAVFIAIVVPILNSGSELPDDGKGLEMAVPTQ